MLWLHGQLAGVPYFLDDGAVVVGHDAPPVGLVVLPVALVLVSVALDEDPPSVAVAVLPLAAVDASAEAIGVCAAAVPSAGLVVALVDASVGPREDAFALHLAVLVLSDVAPAVGPCDGARALSLALLPLAVVFGAVDPRVDARAVSLAVPPIARIGVAAVARAAHGPPKDTKATPHIILPLPIISVIICHFISFFF